MAHKRKKHLQIIYVSHTMDIKNNHTNTTQQTEWHRWLVWGNIHGIRVQKIGDKVTGQWWIFCEFAWDLHEQVTTLKVIQDWRLRSDIMW